MKIFITILLMLSFLDANDLKQKYVLYTEYLGMKTLDLSNEDLKKIIPKLESKLNKDKNYREMILQNKLTKLNLVHKPIEQTICYSKGNCSKSISYASIGNSVKICGGKCRGRTLSEMNEDGWELTDVITNLSGSFGMLFTRK